MHHRTKTHSDGTLTAEADHAIQNWREKAAHVQQRIKDGVATTETTIKDNPWASIGVAAGVGIGVGLLLGLLMRRE